MTAAELSDGKVIEKRRLIVNEFMSLDGVVQAPGAADEDTSGGFNHGGWHLRYMEDQLAQRWALVGIVEAGGFLLERGGVERVTQGVGSHTLGDPGPAGDAAHDPSGAWRSMRLPPVPTKIGPSQRSPTARSDGSGRSWCERHGHDLAAFAQDGERAVAAFEAEVLDVGAPVASGTRSPLRGSRLISA